MPPSPTNTALLDIEAVAERLGVQVRHVRRLVAERRIPFLKWGHLLRFDPSELDKWIDAARVEADTVVPSRCSRAATVIATRGAELSSIDRTPQGRWKARYRDLAGKSRSRTFPTKTAARRFLDVVSADMHRGDWTDPRFGRIRLSDWVVEFLRTATEIDSNTRSTYKRDLEKYVLPRFGGIALADIKPGDIRSWMADELAAGIAASSVHRHFRTLRRVLNAAVDNEILGRAPTARIKPPVVQQTEMRFLTAEQVNTQANELPAHLRVFVLTAAFTGMRWGELIGLRRANVDLDVGCIYVVEQLVRVDREWVRKGPKTAAGRRRIALPPLLTELLVDHVETHSSDAPDALVFPNKAGKPIDRSSFISNFWAPAKERLDLVGVRFHDLRHTAVALAIAQGAHPKSIQARMGHSSVQVTLDRYGHLFPELDAAIATGLDATLRTALRVVDGGLEDTPRTQKTRGGHKVAAPRGISRAMPVRAETRSDRPEQVEAATGIEPVYRALQALA